MSSSNEIELSNSRSSEDYYSTEEARRCSWVNDKWSEENERLLVENQRLLAELDAGRKREEELIEYLVTVQMRLDKLQAIALAQKHTIKELNQRVHGSWKTENVGDKIRHDENKELASSIRIRELEREVNYLTSHVDELSSKAQSKAAAWRYIEVQKDSLNARDELAKSRTLVDELRDQLQHAKAQNNRAQREISLVTAELAATKRAHTELTIRTQEQIDRLIKQMHVLRRKAAKETREEIRQLGLADAEDMQQAMEELRTEVGWLKYLSSILQETCDSLKQQHEEMKDTETALVQTRTELRRVRRELANNQIRETDQGKLTSTESSNKTDEKQQSIDNPMLRIRLDNAKLHKVIHILKTKLARAAPLCHTPYQFVSGI